MKFQQLFRVTRVITNKNPLSLQILIHHSQNLTQLYSRHQYTIHLQNPPSGPRITVQSYWTCRGYYQPHIRCNQHVRDSHEFHLSYGGEIFSCH